MIDAALRAGREVRAHPFEFLYGRGVMLCCAVDGQIGRDGPQGYFAGDTRVLSTYRFTIGGASFHMLGRARPGPERAQWDYQNPDVRLVNGQLESGALLLTVRRRLDGALHDDLEIRSFAPNRVMARFALQIDADFADLFEVKEDSIMPRVSVARLPFPEGLTLEYRHGRFRRALRLRITGDGLRPHSVGSQLIFDLDLARRGEWRCCVDAEPEIGTRRIVLSSDPHGPEREVAPRDAQPEVSGPALLERAFSRGLADLLALAVPQEDGAPYPAGGMPWFLTLFGRDALTTALLGALAGPWLAEGALTALGRLQARETDDWRDAEPGKVPHELRVGELTARHFLPHSPYYGAHDAPELYCLALWDAWRWTGDRALLDAHLDTARRALTWCETLGDRDRDGLLEYATRSPVGYRDQGWKDAGDAILHADGRPAEPPIATVELQAYWYAARLAVAELLEAVGDEKSRETAARLVREAEALRTLVEDRFWMEEEGTYCVALDREKRPVASVTSNPGHVLWCGLASPARAARVAARLLEPDMWTGFGVRTLSSEHPRYDPLAYQRGSVWPHDTALAAAGMWRYGLRDEASTVLAGLLEAASRLEENRLPELFCGLDRAHGGPVPYEQASSPQAWAAAVPLLAARLVAGLVPDAGRGRCHVDPWLPSWLPSLALRGVRVGGGRLDLAVRREDAAERSEGASTKEQPVAAARVEDARGERVEVVRTRAPAAALWTAIE